MKEQIIPKDVEVEDYFIDLPFTTKDRLHRYRKTDSQYIDKYGRLRKAKQIEVRKGRIINNRCYKYLGDDSFELIGVKLPSGDIIGTSPVFNKKCKTGKYLHIKTKDEWEDEKELERIEQLFKAGQIKDIKSYKVLMKI